MRHLAQGPAPSECSVNGCTLSRQTTLGLRSPTSVVPLSSKPPVSCPWVWSPTETPAERGLVFQSVTPKDDVTALQVLCLALH